MLRGKQSRHYQTDLISLGAKPNLTIGVANNAAIDAKAVYRWLTSPGKDVFTSIEVKSSEVWDGLHLWLNLHEPNFCIVEAADKAMKRNLVPYLFRGLSNLESIYTWGLVGKSGLGLLTRSSAAELPLWKLIGSSPALELIIRSFGPDDEPTQRLLRQIKAWDASGRPSNERVCIRVYHSDTKYVPTRQEFAIFNQQNLLVFNWL